MQVQYQKGLSNSVIKKAAPSMTYNALFHHGKRNASSKATFYDVLN